MLSEEERDKRALCLHDGHWIKLSAGVALIDFMLPVAMLLIAVTRAGSISQVKPAEDANSKMLRVIYDVTTRLEEKISLGNSHYLYILYSHYLFPTR